MNRLKAFVLAVGGLFVCSAILTTFGGVFVFSFIDGPRLEKADLVGGAVFVGLSLLVLAIAARASVREWRTPTERSERGLLARGAPVLVLAGLGFGVFFAGQLRADKARWRTESVSSACRLAPVFKLDPAACTEKAQACVEKLYRADPPTVEALAPLQGAVTAEYQAAAAAEKAHEPGAEDRSRLATSLLSDFNNPSWVRRYDLGVTACVGGLLP